MRPRAMLSACGSSGIEKLHITIGFNTYTPKRVGMFHPLPFCWAEPTRAFICHFFLACRSTSLKFPQKTDD